MPRSMAETSVSVILRGMYFVSAGGNLFPHIFHHLHQQFHFFLFLRGHPLL